MTSLPRHSDEIELEIIKELTEKLPHRKVIFQIGKRFQRKGIAERLAAYGEVRLNTHKYGSFHEQQFDIFELFQPTGMPHLIAPLDREVQRKIFDIQQDHCITIIITEKEKVAGTVLIIPGEAELVMDNEECAERQAPPQTEERRCELEIMFKHYELVDTRARTKLRSKGAVARGLCTDTKKRHSGIGSHLQLMRLFVSWLIAPESIALTHASIHASDEKLVKEGCKIMRFGDELIAVEDNSEVLALIPEEDKSKFMNITMVTRFEYEKREQYYQTFKTLILNKAFKSSQSKQ